MNYSRRNRCRRHIAVFGGLTLILLLMFAACAGDAPNSSAIPDTEKSSAKLIIKWHDAPQALGSNAVGFMAALDCQAGGVDQVVCEVYDGTGNWLVTGGPWPCTAGRGTVEGIPAGPNRTFVALAEDLDGNIFYHGETTGILIEPGVITRGVVVDAYPFIPDLANPPEGSEVDPAGFTFEWEDLAAADQYLIQVADEQSFEMPLIEQTTFVNTYVPSALQPSTQYFWRVLAVDRFTNLGAPSEVRSFVTSDCTYAISSPGDTFGQEGGSGVFDVTASAVECRWIAAANVAWIRITEGEEGINAGAVAYEIAANPASAERTGAITAGGQIHTITQEGIECVYRIAPARREFDQAGGTGTIAVSATAGDCSWEAVSNDAWIEIRSNASGSGGGTVGYRVRANATQGERTGSITVAGQQHTVHQTAPAPEPCTYRISPASREFSATGGTGAITVTPSRDECPSWSAVSNDTWIEITSSTNGTVNYSVSANNTEGERTGTITVAGQRHTVRQTAPAPVSCTYRISPIDGAQFSASAGTGAITVTTSRVGCPWTAVSNDNWIRITSGDSGSSSGTVNYAIAANDTLQTRTGTITAAGRTHIITQAGQVCTYDIDPEAREFGYRGSGEGEETIAVTASRDDCPWTAVSNRDWIRITSGAQASGDGTVYYSVATNRTGSRRDGTISVAGRTFSVTQAVPALTAPVQISPADGSVFDYFPRTTTFQWLSVEGAASYSVEVDCSGCCGTGWCTDLGRTWRIESNIQDNTFTHDFVGAQPGRWRVWAVDSAGNRGPASGWWGFRYLQ